MVTSIGCRMCLPLAVVAGVLTCVLTLDAQDPPICGRDPATGRLFNPQPDKFTHCIVPRTRPSITPSTVPDSSDLIQVLEASGEITLMPADGWLPPENTAPRREPLPPLPDVLPAAPGSSTLGFGTILRTGRNAKVVVRLPDNHTLEARDETEVMIERHLRRPLSQDDLSLRLYKGLIRLKILEIRRGKTCYVGGRWCRFIVISPGGIGSVQGTDVEIYAAPDLSGFIKLYEGSFTLEPNDADGPIDIASGQMVTYDAEGRVSGPFPIR